MYLFNLYISIFAVYRSMSIYHEYHISILIDVTASSVRSARKSVVTNGSHGWPHHRWWARFWLVKYLKYLNLLLCFAVFLGWAAGSGWLTKFAHHLALASGSKTNHIYPYVYIYIFHIYTYIYIFWVHKASRRQHKWKFILYSDIIGTIPKWPNFPVLWINQFIPLVYYDKYVFCILYTYSIYDKWDSSQLH